MFFLLKNAVVVVVVVFFLVNLVVVYRYTYRERESGCFLKRGISTKMIQKDYEEEKEGTTTTSLFLCSDMGRCEK